VQPQAFVSAARQPNAFYQPASPPKVNGVKRTFGGAGGTAGASTSTNLNGNVDMGMDTESEDEQQEVYKDEHQREETHGRRTSRGQDHGMDVDESVTLGFSVFGNREQDDTHITRSRTRGVGDKNGKLRTTIGDVAGGASRRVPPGAFLSDEEEEELTTCRTMGVEDGFFPVFLLPRSHHHPSGRNL